MGYKVQGDGSLDFKLQNANFCYIPEIAAVYARLPKKQASKLLWSVYFYTCLIDENTNPFAMYTTKKVRLENIQYLYNKTFNPDKNVELIKVFESAVVLTRAGKHFNNQYQKLQDLDEVYENLDIAKKDDLATYLVLSKSLGTIWESFETARNRVLAEEKQKGITVEGDKKLNRAERRKLDNEQKNTT